MARWRPLPDGLPPEARRLVERLRLLKDRTGLSMSALAARTAYSRSSWQRYLSGSRLAPWQAADALGRLAGEDRARLRAVWQLAAQTWEDPEPDAAAGDAGAPEPGSPKPDRPESDRPPAGPWHLPAPAVPGRRRTWLTAAAAVVAVAVALLVSGSQREGAGTPEWPWALAPAHAAPPGCRGGACDGRRPDGAGCDRDASQLAVSSSGDHDVLLMYSAGCSAVWGEVRPARGTSELSVTTPGSPARPEPPGTARSRMLGLAGAAGTSGAEACARLGSGGTVCAVPPAVHRPQETQPHT